MPGAPDAWENNPEKISKRWSYDEMIYSWYYFCNRKFWKLPSWIKFSYSNVFDNTIERERHTENINYKNVCLVSTGRWSIFHICEYLNEPDGPFEVSFKLNHISSFQIFSGIQKPKNLPFFKFCYSFQDHQHKLKNIFERVLISFLEHFSGPFKYLECLWERQIRALLSLHLRILMFWTFRVLYRNLQ